MVLLTLLALGNQLRVKPFPSSSSSSSSSKIVIPILEKIFSYLVVAFKQREDACSSDDVEQHDEEQKQEPGVVLTQTQRNATALTSGRRPSHSRRRHTGIPESLWNNI